MGCLKYTYSEKNSTLKVVHSLFPSTEKSCAGAYRYGFNGQEEDNEVFEGAVNYKYRMHDARIGRFFAVDPLAEIYANSSPFVFGANQPVFYVEFEGLGPTGGFGMPTPILIGVGNHMAMYGINKMIATDKEIAILRLKHPAWPSSLVYLKAQYNVMIEDVHTVLDVIGLIPGIGEIADGINGGIYLMRGQGVNASLSFAAMIPIAGWASTGAKWAGKTIKSSKGSNMVLQFVRNADGLIEFGNRGQLGSVIVKVAGEEAHHILPWALSGNKVIQKAAELGFHMNDKINGRALKKYIAASKEGVHSTHPAYNEFVEKQLNDFAAKYGDELTPQISKDFIENELVPLLNKHIDKIESSTEKINLNEYFKKLL